MADESDTPPTQPAFPATITPNAAGGPFCAHCGYCLHGLPVQGFCPECGVPIVRAVSGTGGSNGFAIASLVLGISGLVMACASYGLIGLICGPLALYYHSKALARVRDGQAPASSLALARAGRVCGWVAIGIGAFVIVMLALVFGLGMAMPLIGGASGAGGSGGGFGP